LPLWVSDSPCIALAIDCTSSEAKVAGRASTEELTGFFCWRVTDSQMMGDSLLASCTQKVQFSSLHLWVELIKTLNGCGGLKWSLSDEFSSDQSTFSLFSKLLCKEIVRTKPLAPIAGE
jgi:hypothetical protein